MAVVEYSYDEMKKLVNLTHTQIVASLSEIGAPSEYDPETKKITTEITPNRPDWYSVEGLARALKAYYGKTLPKYQTKKSGYKVIVDPSVETVRPYTVCAVVKKLCFDDQRIRDMVLLQEKLIGTLGRKVKKFGLGLYPLHTIKFPVRYTTLRPDEIKYIPLGYDREMTASEILVQHKKGKEHGYIAQGWQRYPVFIDADNKIMCFIPVVNSAETGKVDEQTKEVFIEVTGQDINACKAALNIIVCSFADIGGEVYEVNMEYKKNKFRTPDLKPHQMKLDLEKINKLLGVVLKKSEIGKLLGKMGYRYKKGVVEIPPYRADILGLADIIEDIAIAYGYNNFKPTIPNFFSPGNMVKKHDKLDDVMRGMGFLEAKTFILTNKEKLNLVGFEESVEISNPNNVEYTIVRPNLLVSMLEIFQLNKMRSLPQKFYEIGEVHSKKTTKRIIFGVMDKKVDFSLVRGYLQTLSVEQGFEFKFNKKQMKVFESEFSLGVCVGGKEIGVFGKVNNEILGRLGVETDIYLCELEI